MVLGYSHSHSLAAQLVILLMHYFPLNYFLWECHRATSMRLEETPQMELLSLNKIRGSGGNYHC